MLNELISEFAQWLSEADETQIYNGEKSLGKGLILVNVLLGDKITIKSVLDVENSKFIDQKELDMDIDLFLEIASKLLKNRKKELQKQRIIELSNEEPYK